MTQSGRNARARAHRQPRLAFTTRAIRNALGLSAVALALSGSGAALAGTCIVTGTNEVTCNGVFTDDVTNTVPVINLVPDLTLVVGSDGSTTVDPGFGDNGISSAWGGDATVISYADINTDGGDGIFMYSDDSATAENHGAIYSYGSLPGAYGIDVRAYNDATVTNDGSVTDYSFKYSSIGIVATAYNGDASVDNSGSVSAESFLSQATGINVSAINGAAYLSNDADGQISAYSHVGTAVGAVVVGYTAELDNAGSISAHGSTFADGVVVQALDNATLDNAGTIQAYAGYQGIGAVVQSLIGDAYAYNSGEIYGFGSVATGLLVIANSGYSTVDNSGEIIGRGYSSGTGINAAGQDGVSVDNSGTVSAYAYFYGSDARGIDAFSPGSVEVDNSGDVYAYSYYGNATGIYAHSNGVDATIAVTSSGEIMAISEYTDANGIRASSTYGTVSVDNSGTITAIGDNYANGIYASGTNAEISVANSGHIYSYSNDANSNGIIARSNASVYVQNEGEIAATSYYHNAWGVFATSYDSVDVVNSGTISAYATGFSTGIDVRGNGYGDLYVGNSGSVHVEAGASSANGIFASAAYTGDVYVLNSGDVFVTGDAFANGLSARSVDGDIVIANDGDVTVYSNGSVGMRARVSGTGSIYLENSGTITATSINSNALGIYANAAGGGDVVVVNSGEISATDGNYSLGINLNAHNGGDITTTNTGSVYAYSTNAAYGLESANYGTGDVTVYNSGDVAAYSVYGKAFGAHAILAGGDFYLYNDDSLSASSVYGNASGVAGFVNGADANATVVNAGTIDASSVYGVATGVYLTALGSYGTIDVENSGTISASGYIAHGIYAQAYYGYGGPDYGEVTVYNSGLVSADGQRVAFGIDVHGAVYANVDNAGEIDATAVSDGTTGIAVAVGVQAQSDYGVAQVYNSGTINVFADGGENYYGQAIGASAIIYGGNALTDNSGGVYVEATGAYANLGFGIGAGSSLLSALVYNEGTVEVNVHGGLTAEATGALATAGETAAIFTADGSSISALASGYYNALAYGARADGLFANVYGEGAISAEAIADVVYGDARAYGAHAYGSFTGIYNLGDGAISANAEGAYALAVGAFQDGYFTAFHNEGDIHASATGDTGAAIGSMTLSYYTALQYNDGDISAVAEGDGVRAAGLFAASSDGDVNLYNTGTISASADYQAVAVQLRSDANTYTYNDGSISASGAGTNVAIYASGLSVDTIRNYGSITGALWLGDGDDYLYNGAGGVWNPGTTPTDFGAGDDSIVNYGTINLADSAIHMGTYSVYGNYFLNAGVVNVNGTDNWIDMGGPQALVPSLNPLPFYNYGTIDFTDGAANDYLLITGDFAGEGDINVDVSGLNEVSDTLYIDGSVVTGTVQTINVELLDLPESIETIVPMVYVSGDSVAGNFTLGDVNWDENDSFVTLDFSLISDIDASNATPDVFSLGIEVTGLSDPGTLAASIPGAIQSLANSSVGTWRQRMGVIDQFNKGAVSLWARVWQDKGSWDVDHHADNFGQGGTFNWDQKNSGVEAGIDFAVTDEFSIGLLVGKSKADTNLDDPGTGHSDIDADTWGVYGTWISPTGFYLDASYRWMSFDVDLHSVAGKMSFDDNAETFNLELGYAWTLAGGLKIEPQFQYTKTNLDDFDPLVTSTGMSFVNQGGESTHLRLGVSFRKNFGEAEAGWLWSPYVTISAVRENDGENLYSINNVFHGETDVGGTSALLELGFTARHQNWSIYGGLNWQDGGAVNSFFGGQLGVRYTFGGPAPVAPPPPPPAKTCADLDDDGDGVNNCDDKCTTPTGEAVGLDGCPVPAPAPEPMPEPKPFRG